MDEVERLKELQASFRRFSSGILAVTRATPLICHLEHYSSRRLMNKDVRRVSV